MQSFTQVRLPLMLMLAIVLAMPPWAAAGPATQPAMQTADSVWAALGKAQHASQRLTYQGVLSIQSGKHMQFSRVTHVWDAQHGEFESIETLQGKPVEWIRHNEDVQSVIHETKTIRLDRRHATRAFSGLLAGRIDDLMERYTVTQKEGERVAGLDTLVYELRPRDVFRYGYRLWIDRDNGLLVRSQTLGEHDEVLEQVGFTEIRIGQLPERNKPRFRQPGEGWRLDEAVVAPSDAVPLLIGFKPGVPGFRQVSASLRRARNTIVNQYVYTDGMASVSVFVEQFDPTKPQSNVVIQHGAVRTATRRVGDYAVTAMGEVPLGTVKQFLNDIEIRKP